MHVDVKHLPKLRTSNAESRNRPPGGQDDETERSAVAFLKEAVPAFPFRVSHVLTERGSCFYSPWVRGGVPREVLGITVASHPHLDTLLRDFNQPTMPTANASSRGRSPDMVVHERLSAAAAHANPGHDPPLNPCILPKALQSVLPRTSRIQTTSTLL